MDRDAIMNNSTAPARQETSFWEPKYPFDLVLTYEDTATRNQAMQLYDHLAQNLLDDYDFQCSWWRLGLLRDPVLLDQAGDAAADANMLILALRSGDALSESARKWIETWVPRKDDRKSALVALIGGNEPADRAPSAVQLYLQRIARVAKMDFFAHTFDLESEKPRYSVDSITERARRVTPVLDDILHTGAGVPRWGINE